MLTGVEGRALAAGGTVAGSAAMEGVVVVGTFLAVSCGVHEKQNQVYNRVLDRNSGEEISQTVVGQTVANNHQVHPHHTDLQM
jgi:broad specificity polyphosphatase/5'/3'-nucleotidase SurE